MPTGRKGKGQKSRQQKTKTTPSTGGSLSACKLPNDVVVNILSRLPVKTLLLFRLVCKSWKSLILSPKFIAIHLSHSRYTSPSLLLHSRDGPTSESEDKISLVSLSHAPPSLSSRSVINFPYPSSIYFNMDVVGTHNGVVCVSRAPWGDFITVFNPAIRDGRILRLPPVNRDPNLHERVSVGFGFDPSTQSYKVISILVFKKELKNKFLHVRVYSCNLDSWKNAVAIKGGGPKYHLSQTKCSAVIKGVPYWVATIEDECDGKRGALVWFDFHNDVLRHMAPPPGDKTKSFQMLVDWKGDLGVLERPRSEADGATFVDVWLTANDGAAMGQWTKKYRVGPILGMKWMVGCSQNGQIVGVNRQGLLFLFDSETGRLDNFVVEDGENYELSGEVFNYSQSLVRAFGSWNPLPKGLSL